MRVLWGVLLPEVRLMNVDDGLERSARWFDAGGGARGEAFEGPPSLCALNHRIWVNWLKNQRFRPAVFAEPRTLGDIQTILRRAAARGLHVRAGASGHCSSALVPTDGVLVSTTHLTRFLGVSNDVIEVEAGIKLKDLVRGAAAAGLSVPGTAIYADMTAGGLAATGSHGTGLDYPCFSESIIGMTLVRADGEVVHVDESEPHLLRAARVSLGLLGITYSLRIRCVPAMRLLSRFYRVTLDEGLAQLGRLARDDDHVAVFWHPFTRWMFIHTGNRTDKAIRFNPLARALHHAEDFLIKYLTVALIDQWFCHSERSTPVIARLMPHVHRPYSKVWGTLDGFHYIGAVYRCWLAETLVPVEHAEAACRRIMALIDNDAKAGRYPVNLAIHARFVKAGDAYLSMTRDRDSCCIDIVSSPSVRHWPPFVDRLHADMAERFGGRPHWGKAFFRTDGLRELYGVGFDRFDDVRRSMDPGGVLLNDFLRPLFEPGAAGENGSPTVFGR